MSKFSTALLAPLSSPMFVGDPKGPTATAGDNDTSLATTAFVSTAVGAGGGGGGAFYGGLFSYVNATSLRFVPFKGDKIKINGTAYSIPSSGIAGLANTSVFVNGTAAQNLAANTTYWVYAFLNSSTVTADFSTTGHATSSTTNNVGVEIKSGDDTRSLIGLIRTNASSQFVDSATQRFVLSWFNTAALQLTNNITANKSTTSATFVEWDSTRRVEFLVWSNSIVSVLLYGTSDFSSGVANGTIGIGFDGVNAEPQQSFLQGSLNVHLALSLNKVGLSEGYHYATPLFAAQSGASMVVYGGTASMTTPSPGGTVPSGINVLVQSGASGSVGLPSGALVLLASYDLNGVGQTYNIPLPTGYDVLELDCTLYPATADRPGVRFSTDGGATYHGSAGEYWFAGPYAYYTIGTGAGGTSYWSGSNSFIPLALSATGPTNPASIRFTLKRPTTPGVFLRWLELISSVLWDGTNMYTQNGAGVLASNNNPLTHIQFLTVTSGYSWGPGSTVKVYGR